MDTTPVSAVMPPPDKSSPETEQQGSTSPNPASDGQSKHGGKGTKRGSDRLSDAAGGPVSAAGAARTDGPKVVQTAFIHKLYKYAEHLSEIPTMAR